MMDKQRLKKAVAKMATIETKWEKEFEELRTTSMEVGSVVVISDEDAETIQAFILSTLQEYADKVCDICDDMDLMLAIAQSTTEDTPHKEIVEMLGGTRDNLKQVLSKLNTTYGLKGDK